jgi:ferredoxin
MAHVVAEPCINCRYTECASVCPVDCFYEGVNFLVIHPDECIDCGACIPVCPANAIFADGELPERWARFRDLNAQYSRVWPRIVASKPRRPDADQWAEVQDKGDLLDPRPGGSSPGASPVP